MKNPPRFLSSSLALSLAAGMVVMLPTVAMAAAVTVQTPAAPLPLDELWLFTQVFGQIKQEYVEPVDDAKLMTAAIKGMVSSLDPHSSYRDKADFQEWQEQITGRFAGIGLNIAPQDDGLIEVVSPLEDSPAAHAGIRPGDLITRVDDKPVQGMTEDQAITLMRGAAGTKVILTLFRKTDNRTFPVTVTRAIINVQSVTSAIPVPGYAYVRITGFQERTTPDLAAKLAEIARREPDLKGLVLDLRNNGGGLVQSAVGVAGAFLPRDSVVVTTNGQADYAKSIYRDSYADYRLPFLNHDPLKNEATIFKTVPMIVLTNAYTASASEIVAGALQDHHRALILGKTTFGKGSVQTSRPLTEDSSLSLTTAYYYTPAGRSIQNIGILPDLPIDQFADGDPDDTRATREADYPNRLSNIQDPNEKKELEAREAARLAQLHLVEQEDDKMTPEQRQKDRNRAQLEFGSRDDFMLQQALNKLEGKPVLESKATLAQHVTQNDTPRAPSEPSGD
jgi:carboxyl-terminal processing protease